MEDLRMQYENLITRSHNYVSRLVAGADANDFDTFSGLLGEMEQTETPSLDLVKNFYLELGRIQAYMMCAITIYIDRKGKALQSSESVLLNQIVDDIKVSQGKDFKDLIQRATEIYDRQD